MELLEYIHKGGVIAWVLLVMGTFGVSIVLYKVGEFYKMSRSLHGIWEEMAQANPSGAHMKEHIALFVSKKEYGLPTVRTIATISPLLGLLGTVLGVLLAFE